MKYQTLTLLITGICCALLIVFGAAWFFYQRPSVSLDTLTILGETPHFVEVEHEARTGRLYKHFQTNFEEPEFLDWFGDERWTTMTLLSPHAKTVDAYAALRRDIFAGRQEFIDNRIVFEAVNVHSGKGAARFKSVAPTADMVTAKSMLEHNQLWFVKGDELWFRAWYYLESGVPFTIVDFQERGRHNSPGPRICIWEQQFIGVELKAWTKPKLKQTLLPVPLKRWFELRVYMKLDESNGHVRVWQDGTNIIDDAMPTLHSADSILNALEVGITATGTATSLIVDDVQISQQPIP